MNNTTEIEAPYGVVVDAVVGCDDDDICGICGESGADKMALWTGGGIYWPGEFRPETELVHAECERAETARAHAALTQEQRDAVLRSI